ncbi:MAG: MCP four helix bundle domain-containing protein [Desulfotignum sp.]|nr:MCP four helix bundle domain-containing protein [Desulfotignum sp.]MCF8089392.1 MCP four helix bundle domain-containing protein [Desulfotignum sp.]MCF8137842.1 MCP four helix bundle domain-containing protein [Desulfotignum sp.]
MLQLSLKNRIYMVNAILVSITVIGGLLMIWYTYKTEKIFQTIIDKNIVVYQSAESLAAALVKHKGFVSYYLLDKNPIWIDRLHQIRDTFTNHMDSVKSLVEEDWEKQAIAQIESNYTDYITTKDRVIDLYISGEFQKGYAIHETTREHFAQILDLCEQFKTFHKNKISAAIETSREESNRLRYMALMAIIIVIILSLLINYIFARHILGPIRKIAEEAYHQGDFPRHANEVAALELSVHGLIKNTEQVHQDLKKSQETLLQSEKMALLGKLAAGTAHSIRNPLTSVKMRLFSLNRSCEFTDAQQEDFNVISGEIQQINKIVDNFLEFSRPPRLKTRNMSPSLIVDSALNLLEQRLQSYRVSIKLVRSVPLSQTRIDPEQLKEVIVNIIINACEAIKHDGRIIISEEERFVHPLEKVAIIRIMDDGPGIPDTIQSEIFNPFFTTKDHGTGLGLSISYNIIAGHGGWLDVSSREGQGAAFVITLPIREG